MKSADIDRLLPGVFQQTLEDDRGPLRALLNAMETLHAPVEELLTGVDAVFDAYRTPVDGLWQCGAGTDPGGGVMGASGRNAAFAILGGRA